VSNTLKKLLLGFGITEIPVRPIVGNKFDVSHLSFENLNNMAYIGLRCLNVEDITRCSNMLVSHLMDNSNLLLHILYDYDDVTYNHSINVASLSLTCAMRLGLSKKELYLLSFGCLVHDIGKTRISHEILSKPGKLTEEEFEEIKKHPIYGYEMLNELNEEIPDGVEQIVLQHHEDHDGTGYPYHVKDFHIYKLARLVHIADCYEALCSKRAYKDALPRDVVREFMLDEAGNKFDPIMLRKFLNTIPMYLIGEEIECNGIKGVIIDTNNESNPLVSVNKDIVRLSDFQNVKYAKQEAYSDCMEIIFC
jgi:putative nucleotidyltransferase with HDIG domain